MKNFIELEGRIIGFDKKPVKRFFNCSQIIYVESNPNNAEGTHLYFNKNEVLEIDSKLDEIIKILNSN